MEIKRLVDIPGATIAGRATIDNSTNDNGYLQYARQNNPQAGRHNSTQEAANNLPGGDTNKAIVGHGNRALIVTGTGQSASDPKKYIYLYNQSDWQTPLSALKGQCTTLYLYACHPGTSSEGADFLYNIARVVNCTVLGPTGFIYINAQGYFTLEAKSTWQSATPTHRPNPIEAPTPYFTIMVDALTIVIQGKPREYAWDDIVSFSFIPLLRNPENREPAVTVQGYEAQLILRRINLAEPFIPPGVPAALITGRIIIKFRDVTKSFKVLNDLMLEDEEHPEIHYNCSKDFASTMLSYL